jgi:hypothetical protein
MLFIQRIRNSIIFFLLFAVVTGCDPVTVELVGGNISLQDSLEKTGLKGYAIDSAYTEFEFYKGKNVRITQLRKGIATFHADGTLESVKWTGSNPRIEYRGSAVSYSHEGLYSEITLNEYGFAEVIENRLADGTLQSRVDYYYTKNTGYLNYVRLERPGTNPVYITFKYPDSDNANNVLISEPDLMSGIPLLPVANRTLENTGYVCNILSYGTSPLTNTYVINPDFYYMGFYGTPMKYLPDKLIENGTVRGGSVITRIGNWRFFYR